jgi:hypothetical protein
MSYKRVPVCATVAATGWVAAVALLAWSSLNGPEVASRWALLLVGASVLIGLDSRIRTATRVVCEVNSLQLRMHAPRAPEPRAPLARVK